MATALAFTTAGARPACADEDPELFFTDGSHQMVAQARAVCMRCPLRHACLEYALQALPSGIWGGTTADQRRAMTGSKPSTATSAPKAGLLPCGTTAAARRHTRRGEKICTACLAAVAEQTRARDARKRAFLTGTAVHDGIRSAG